jgi:hypothetical protein
METRNPKRVLVACNHLESVGGSELYTYYLIKSLKSRKDLIVEYFTFQRGLVSEKIEQELRVEFKTGNEYDLILASHLTTVSCLFGQGTILQICHGIAHELEQPSSLANYHIAVSEEVAGHLLEKGFKSKVILNGVDLDVFCPAKPLNKAPAKVLSLCQSEEANGLLKEICREKGMEFLGLNKHVNPKFQISEEINQADLVVGIGRSVYDAMACGRPCLVFDQRAYNGNMGDGYLYPNRFKDFARFNCSGRFSKKPFTREELLSELENYDPKHGEELRQIAQEELNLNQVAKKLLRLGARLGGRHHKVHQASVYAAYPKHYKEFKKLKRKLRAKMKNDFEAGIPVDRIRLEISQDKYPMPVRFGLYVYGKKLGRKVKDNK